MRFAIILFAIAALAGGEWGFALPAGGGAEHVVALPLDAFAGARGLMVRVRLAGAPADAERWCEVCIESADGRFFASAAPIPASGESGRYELPFAASHWCGGDGPLSADAVAAVRSLRIRVHGAVLPRAEVTGSLRSLAGSTGGSPRLLLEAPGRLRLGPWDEVRFRLVGALRGEAGEVDLVGGDGRRVPCFLDQPGRMADGRWRGDGPARWVARLGADEDLPPPWKVAWRDGPEWISPAWTPGLASTGALAAIPDPGYGQPRSAGWRGRPQQWDGRRWLTGELADLAPCPAPLLSWRADWTAYRGPSVVGHQAAQAFDAELAKGVPAIDLLSESWFGEQGSLRFGLAPWHERLATPLDAADADASTVADWMAHARTMLARARAAPGLAHWRMGLREPATGDAQLAGIRRLAEGLARLVAASDCRPLLVLHPQVADWGRSEPKGVWYGFEQGLAGWVAGPAPLGGSPRIVTTKASEGAACLGIAFPPGPGPRSCGVLVDVDSNLFNLDRLEFDAALDGGGPGAAVQLYAWATDEHHRWYQQALGRIAVSGRFVVQGVDCADPGAWQAVGHQAPWSAETRRRVRRMGIIGFLHDPVGKPAELQIDRVRRWGWPQRAVEPAIALQQVAEPPARIAVRAPLACDFRLSVEARNPYDPDDADVMGEAESPDGQVHRHPAWWEVPYRLDFTDGQERAAPAGPGLWRWRYPALAAGRWRWRLIAKVKDRDRWQSVETPWRTVEVGGDADAAQPIPLRVAAADPAWFEDAEGHPLRPLGLTLRSPGDSRADRFCGELAARGGKGAFGAVFGRDHERLGTRAYESWFQRMAEQGADFARVWMCPWWCGLEWRRDWDGYGGLTWYNQANACRLDRVVELAAARGIRLQIEVQNHGMTSDAVDRQWQDSPYNRWLGGPCGRAAEFFSGDAAWAIHQKRLRYTLARWGWRTSIAAWSLSSELEFTGAFRAETGGNDWGDSPTTQRWVERSLAWFTANDPLAPARPVTVHFSHPWAGPGLWREVKGLGFGYSNAYTGFQDLGQLGGRTEGRRDLGRALSSYLSDHFDPATFHRPTALGEWGGHWDQDNTVDGLLAEWHAGLWMQAVMPYGANGGYWWWTVVDVGDWWKELGPVARFQKGEDHRGRRLALAEARPSRRDVQAVGMAGPDRQRWYVCPRGHDQARSRRLAGDAGVLLLPAGAAGETWAWERWDCTAGKPVGQGEIKAGPDGRLRLPLGALDPDAAFKLERR